VIIEYQVHGKIVATGTSYDNRFISVVTIEDRKIVRWRDYMDSLPRIVPREAKEALRVSTTLSTHRCKRAGQFTLRQILA
jgi:hypothetical protein